MLKVIYPNGNIITYNDANHCVTGNTSVDLYTNKTKNKWIATIQNSAQVIVEAEHYYKFEKVTPDLTVCFEQLKNNIRSIRGVYLKQLKDILKNFDSNNLKWKI